jgi:cystathionine beta-lyase
VSLRYEAHDQSARALAEWLQGRPEVARVLHPALAGSPGHEHWRAVCADDGDVAPASGRAAGLFSVVLDSRFDSAAVDAFCDGLRLFKLGFSWGGPISLVVPYDMRTMRSAALGTWRHAGLLVRFSVGLEAAEDLRADLEQALARLG